MTDSNDEVEEGTVRRHPINEETTRRDAAVMGTVRPAHALDVTDAENEAGETVPATIPDEGTIRRHPVDEETIRREPGTDRTIQRPQRALPATDEPDDRTQRRAIVDEAAEATIRRTSGDRTAISARRALPSTAGDAWAPPQLSANGTLLRPVAHELITWAPVGPPLPPSPPVPRPPEDGEKLARDQARRRRRTGLWVIACMIGVVVVAVAAFVLLLGWSP